ncbi:uncharacterized protein LOC141849746 [Brevipalpus obovatus]|uniref:uncharacterized protein LOC141849746 n=1 Tax=Brevipalpus obovatus TaxID=246614 RepID=UPI003D9DE831
MSVGSKRKHPPEFDEKSEPKAKKSKPPECNEQKIQPKVRKAKPGKSKPALPKRSKKILLRWLVKNRDNPYPPEDMKRLLASLTGLTVQQVSNWFINARRREMETFQTEEGNPPKKVTQKRLLKKHDDLAKYMDNTTFDEFLQELLLSEVSPLSNTENPSSSPTIATTNTTNTTLSATSNKSRVPRARKRRTYPTRGRKVTVIKDAQSPATSLSSQRNSSADSGAGDSLDDGADTPSSTSTPNSPLSEQESSSPPPPTTTTSGINWNNDAPLKPSLRWRINHEQELRKPLDSSPSSPSSSLSIPSPSSSDNSNLGQDIQPAPMSPPSQVISSIEVRVIKKAPVPKSKKSQNVQPKLQDTPLSKEHDNPSCIIQIHPNKSHPESSPTSPISSSTESDMEVSEINSRAERPGKSDFFQQVDDNNDNHHNHDHDVSNTTTTIEKVFISSSLNANVTTVPMKTHPSTSAFYSDLSHRPILFPITPNPTPTPMSLTTTTIIPTTSLVLNPVVSSFSPSLRIINADANRGNASVILRQSIESLSIQDRHRSHWKVFAKPTLPSNSTIKEPQYGPLEMLASAAVGELEKLENLKCK